MTKPESMLTVRQVGELLSMDKWSVYDLIHSGELVAHDVGKGERKSWRVKPSVLDRFLESRRSDA